MTSKSNPLESYTQKGLELRQFREKNKKVLSAFDSLLVEANAAETDLKNYAREQKQNLKNQYVKVTFAPAFRKWYDVDFLLKKASPKLVKVLEKECVEKVIDKKRFEELVDEGVVPKELKVEAYRERELLSRVIIKENYDEQEEDNKKK